MKTAEQIRATITENTRADGECALWTGAVDKDGYPRIFLGKDDGRIIQKNVARLIREMDGLPLAPSEHISASCENRRCLHHLTIAPRGRVGGKTATKRRGYDPEHYPCGHPRSPENTASAEGGRCCWICRKKYHREYNRRRPRHPKRNPNMQMNHT